jgi:phosphoribosylformimino-5-aminoimidazole carboxamide ribotide isomerase
MRVIPVIDLLEGQAVHAIRGIRKNYKPLKSVLCNSSDPVRVAKAFRDLLGLHEIYIADLSAIQGSMQKAHCKTITELAMKERMALILDAGISEIKHARDFLNLGISKVAIGSETLRSWELIDDFTREIDSARLVFSLDLRRRKILSRCPVLSAMAPLEALEHLQSAGWKEVILLDLARVGTGNGADRDLISEVRSEFPDLCCLIGGGIAHPGELAEMQRLGASAVLVATAIHTGAINAGHISVSVRQDV